MTRKTMALCFVVLALLVCGCTQRALGQEKEKGDTAETAVGYRLDYSVNEMEDGKKINTRQYSMNLSVLSGKGWDGDTNSIKIGARVPVEPKNGEFQYLDIGTNIWSRLREHGSTLTLEVRADISNIATATDQQYQQSRPIVRQVQINGSTVVLPGKPMVIGVADDPTSRKQFQLEVMVTKLR